MTGVENPDEAGHSEVTDAADVAGHINLSNSQIEDDGAPEAPIAPEFHMPEIYRPLAFIEVTLDLPSQYPTVVLQEFDAPHRQIAIPIGMAEGNAIAFAAKRIPTQRPLTHALMISILEEFGVEVLTLRITDVDAGSYSAELVLSGPSGQKTLPCRVSDGIALCLRQRPPVPITALPSVIDQAGSPA